jgi:hypothetical protein
MIAILDHQSMPTWKVNMMSCAHQLPESSYTLDHAPFFKMVLIHGAMSFFLRPMSVAVIIMQVSIVVLLLPIGSKKMLPSLTSGSCRDESVTGG